MLGKRKITEYRFLSENVNEPGDQITFNFVVTAPSSPGYYDFQWRMIQESTGWFGDATVNVPIDVYSFDSCDPTGPSDCRERGGWWDSSTCECNDPYYY